MRREPRPANNATLSPMNLELALWPTAGQRGSLSPSHCWAPSSFLICCESSGVVREELRAAGVDAWSCDILPAEDGSPHHIQGDCREAMRSREWDGFGMHPPCTYLGVSGIHWNNRGRGWEKTDAALAFVRELMDLAGDKPWYLENPVSIISTRIRKPTQTIQPYDFGEDASKRTCLWLNRLPPLRPTQRVAGRVVNGVERWANQTDSGQNKLPPGKDRWKERSRTYPGIARAMATQWAPLLLPNQIAEPQASQGESVGSSGSSPCKLP